MVYRFVKFSRAVCIHGFRSSVSQFDKFICGSRSLPMSPFLVALSCLTNWSSRIPIRTRLNATTVLVRISTGSSRPQLVDPFPRHLEDYLVFSTIVKYTRLTNLSNLVV